MLYSGARHSMLPLCALFLALAYHTSAAFNTTILLDNWPSGTSYSCFKDLLAKSDANDKFYESDSFTGSFLAFTDDACSTFATAHGFANKEDFLNSTYAMEYADEMINLHILPDLKVDTTSTSPYFVAANDTRPMYVKVVTSSNGEPASFIYPTFAYPPEESFGEIEESGSEEEDKDEETGEEEEDDEEEETGEEREDEESSEEEEGEETGEEDSDSEGEDEEAREEGEDAEVGEEDEDETEDDGSRRKLLSRPSADIIDRVVSPSGTKQVFYINKVLVPVTLTNELASRESTAYDAIAATPSLSMFKTIVDQDIDGINELRNQLKSANYSGTVFCPHDDAFHTLFSALDTTAGDFAQQFPSVLTQMVQYHILPFAFNVTELTMPGNGIEDEGMERQDGQGRGNRGDSDNERSDEPDNDGGDDDSEEDDDGNGNGNGIGNGQGKGRKLLQGGRAENRFQTNRPGPRFDLNVIKTGDGRIKIRGKRTQADLLTPESQIVVSSDSGEKVFMHIIDDVLRFSNIAHDNSVQALFGAGSRVKPEGKSFDGVADALQKAGKLTNGKLVLDGYTFIAPSDDAFEQLAATRGTTVDVMLADDQKEFLEDLIDAHTVKFGPSDELLDGDIIPTKLEGTNVLYNIDDAGNESFTLTSDDATFTTSASRRRLLSTASISSTATTDDGQIMYAEGTLTSTDSGAWQAAPSLVLLLAAALAALIF